jgi:hypothetical protein
MVRAGMSSPAGRGHRNRAAAAKGTRFHAIMVAVCSREFRPVTRARTPEEKVMYDKALGIRTWAEFHGWHFHSGEARVKVGRSVSYLDLVYLTPDRRGSIYIEAKYGYRGLFVVPRDPTSLASVRKSLDNTKERRKHLMQVAGGCMGWNEERRLASEAVARKRLCDSEKKGEAEGKKKGPTKKELDLEAYHEEARARPPMVKGYLYYTHGRGPEEVPASTWSRHSQAIIRRWNARGRQTKQKKK